MKKCYTCDIQKPSTDYRKDKKQKDGFAINCKVCMKAYGRNWYKQHKNEDYGVRKRKNAAKNSVRKRIIIFEFLEKSDGCGKVSAGRRIRSR